MTTKKTTGGAIRFAAYLRVSTDMLQTPAESRRWQLARCESVIVGHGTIVCEFFDQGQSRSIPWKRRPEATALLAEAARKDRRFDAVVVAEPARAFAGAEFSMVFPVLTHHGVELWVPEVGGRVDPDSEAHDMVMALFGGMSKGERSRIKMRTKTAMHAQAKDGRWLGGRPPYGYRVVDTDQAHPNTAKAKEGKKLKRLEPDPATAPVVRRIFESYLNGMGLRALADELTAEAILSPSGYDPERNPHRQHSCGAWSRGALMSVLKNPSYTGRRVYGRQRRVDVLLDATDPSQGYQRRLRSNDPGAWTFAAEPTHEPLVTPQQFQAASERLLARQGGRGPQELAKGRQPYPLRGLIVCAECGKRLEALTDKYGTRYYRCRLTRGEEYSRLGPAGQALEETHPKSSYLREDLLVPALNGWLLQVFDPERAEETAKVLAADAADEAKEARHEAQADHWHGQLLDAEGRLEKYRALVEEGGAPAEVVGRWIAEAERDRRAAEVELARLVPERPPTVDEVKRLIAQMRRVVGRLSKADPKVLGDAYRALGVHVSYVPRSERARVEVTPGSPIMSRSGHRLA